MIRRFSARVDVLRGGVPLKQLLFSAGNPPTVMADKSSAIKMSLAGTFLHDPEVDYLTDELRPVITIDGVESAVGVFPVGSVVSSSKLSGVVYDRIEAYDRALLLNQCKTENLLHFQAGTNYLTAVRQLLTKAGIAQTSEVPTTHTLATDREDWEIGTSFLTIINALLTEINYTDIWFNSQGVAMLQPYQEPSAQLIKHRYSAEDPLTVLQPETSSELDIYDSPNVFIAVVSNPDLSGPMTATAVNDNPTSRLSTVRRGRRIPHVVRVDNIASQAELQAYVNKLAYQSMLSGEVVSAKTLAEGGHGIGDIVAVTHPQITGIFEETAWSMSLAAGRTMTHEWQRVVYV